MRRTMYFSLGLLMFVHVKNQCVQWEEVQTRFVATFATACAIGAFTCLVKYVEKKYDLSGERAEREKRWVAEYGLRQRVVEQDDAKIALDHAKLCTKQHTRLLKIDPNNKETLNALLRCMNNGSNGAGLGITLSVAQ
jgi:hypothetical protein